MNNLLYLFVVSFFILIANLATSSYPHIGRELEVSGNGIVGLILVQYVLQLIVSYSFSIATPIATLLIVKPTRTALKILLGKCVKCRGNSTTAQE